jgi:DNA-binding PadR family transcriptional regulator
MATSRSRRRLRRASDCCGRSYGLDIVELAQILGEDDEHGRARISAALNRAVRDGLVQFTGGRMDRVYRVTERGLLAMR